jgi:hypothetical protein
MTKEEFFNNLDNFVKEYKEMIEKAEHLHDWDDNAGKWWVGDFCNFLYVRRSELENE